MTHQQVPRALTRWGIYLSLMLPVLLLCYTTDRNDTGRVLILYLLPFIAYGYILTKWHESFLKEAILVSILIRVLLLFSSPQLSDDAYRFIWDGHLQKNGINPYEFTPYEVMQEGYGDAGGLNKNLYNLLNSREYYSVYPPAAQLLFHLCSQLSFSNDAAFIFLLKFFLFLMESITILLLPQLLKAANRNPLLSLWYLFNPLVIVELTGNIHLETAMIAWCTIAAYLYWVKKIQLAGIAAGVALSFKFTPLMVFPLLIRPLGWKQALTFSVFAGFTFLLGFTVFLNDALLINLSNSVGLYFHTFEFNGSIFYLYRLADEQKEFWRNLMRIAGPLLTITIIIAGSRRSSKLNLASWILLCLGTYLLLSGNVHPWYIAPLVILAPFSGMRFPIIWSFMILLTYTTYRTSAYTENYWLILTEYTLVYATLLADIYNKRSELSE